VFGWLTPDPVIRLSWTTTASHDFNPERSDQRQTKVQIVANKTINAKHAKPMGRPHPLIQAGVDYLNLANDHSPKLTHRTAAR
jgi:hypothetical protein